MPGSHAVKAHFSDELDKPDADFLQEHDKLAIAHGLSDKQNAETVPHRVSYSIRNLLRTLDGHTSSNWDDFRATLEELYPDLAAIET
jgi:hypothetical protein